jgi:hypothetical protein
MQRKVAAAVADQPGYSASLTIVLPLPGGPFSDFGHDVQ